MQQILYKVEIMCTQDREQLEVRRLGSALTPAERAAATRRSAFRCACFAVTALLGPLLMLPATARAQGRHEAGEEAEHASEPRRDFRFAAPRVSLGLRGGWAFNRAEGEIYDFLTDQLTLEKSDFNAPAGTIDFSLRLTSWLDAVFGVEYSGRETSSEDRYFEDEFGNPIEQDTRLTQVPITFSLKLYPIGRGRQVGQYAWVRKAVVPYLGGGIGPTWYELKQKGDFVHETDPDDPNDDFCQGAPACIFEDAFSSEDWTFAQHAFLGVDIKLTRNLGLILEGRYYWADADVGGDYIGFDPIDLDGARVMIGINWKL
jgi:opacity protein-like surface antigen